VFEGLSSLTWTSAPLAHDLDVIGDIEVQLFLAADLLLVVAYAYLAWLAIRLLRTQSRHAIMSAPSDATDAKL